MSRAIDQAADYAERHTLEAIAKQQAKIKTTPSYSHCEDCGEPIPEKRQLCVKGCTRCYDCQNDLEHLNKGYAHG